MLSPWSYLYLKYFIWCGWLQDFLRSGDTFPTEMTVIALQDFSDIFRRNSFCSGRWLKRCNPFIKVYSKKHPRTYVPKYLGTEVKHSIIITVHLFVLIQWPSQQVPQPIMLSWQLQGCWINNIILSCILSACIHRHKEHRQISKARVAEHTPLTPIKLS